MAMIKVPKTPRTAFNKSRRPSALLLAQIQHLEWAALPASQRKPDQLPKQKVKTEGQAAERIAQLTKVVLAAKAGRTAVGEPETSADLQPVVLPPLPTAGRVRRSAPRRSPKRAASRRRSSRPTHHAKSTDKKGTRRTRGRS